MSGDYRSNFTGDQISLAIRKALDFDPDRIPMVAILNDASTPYDINNLIEPNRYTINYITNGTGLMENVHPIKFEVFEMDGLIYQQTTILDETYYRSYDPNTKEFSEWYSYAVGNTVPTNSKENPLDANSLTELGSYTVNYLTGIPSELEGFNPYEILIYTKGDTKYQLITAGDKAYVREYLDEEDKWSDIWTDINAIKEVDATQIKGIINIANLPQGALERMITVETKSERLALTIENVQNGDTVKQMQKDLDDENSVDEQLFRVIDETLLGTENAEDAFTPYTTGYATSVPWSGVTDTPDTLEGYGIKARYMMYSDETDEPTDDIGFDAKTLNGKTAKQIIAEAQASIYLKDENNAVWELKIREGRIQADKVVE